MGIHTFGKNVMCDGEAKGEIERRVACFSHIHDDFVKRF